MHNAGDDDHYPVAHKDNNSEQRKYDIYEATLLTMPSTISTNACAALLLLQLLAFVFATVITVVLNVSVVCTVAVAVAVLDTVIFPLWTHATSLMKDTEDVEMS